MPLLQHPPHLAAEARVPASDPDNPLFRQVGENSRLRSHPDVARRHYAGIVGAGGDVTACFYTTPAGLP